jgi:hypothetical protein
MTHLTGSFFFWARSCKLGIFIQYRLIVTDAIDQQIMPAVTDEKMKREVAGRGKISEQTAVIFWCPAGISVKTFIIKMFWRF